MRIRELESFLKKNGSFYKLRFLHEDDQDFGGLYLKLQEFFLDEAVMLRESDLLQMTKQWQLKGSKLHLVHAFVEALFQKTRVHTQTFDIRLQVLKASQACRSDPSVKTVEDFRAAYAARYGQTPWDDQHDLYADVEEHRILPRILTSEEFSEACKRFNEAILVNLGKYAEEKRLTEFSDKDLIAHLLHQDEALTVCGTKKLYPVRLKSRDLQVIFA